MAIQQDNIRYEYFAFISYKREDEKWAKWLQRKLESYSLPTTIRKENPELPNKIRPVFRDQSELSGGNLKTEIEKGLNGSKYLIVICSPRSAKSPWVSKEVQHFIDQGREEYIIPFIIGGTPNASNPEEECFPEGLRQLTGEKEILGININEMGRDAASIKVIARMFDLRFDSLWQRFEKAKRNKRIWIGICALIMIVLSLGIAGYIGRQNTMLINANKTIIAERDRANRERDRAESLNMKLSNAFDSIESKSKQLIDLNKNLDIANISLINSNNLLKSEKRNLIEANKKIKSHYVSELLNTSKRYSNEDNYKQAIQFLLKAYSLDSNNYMAEITKLATEYYLHFNDYPIINLRPENIITSPSQIYTHYPDRNRNQIYYESNGNVYRLNVENQNVDTIYRLNHNTELENINLTTLTPIIVDGDKSLIIMGNDTIIDDIKLRYLEKHHVGIDDRDDELIVFPNKDFMYIEKADTISTIYYYNEFLSMEAPEIHTYPGKIEINTSQNNLCIMSKESVDFINLDKGWKNINRFLIDPTMDIDKFFSFDFDWDNSYAIATYDKNLVYVFDLINNKCRSYTIKDSVTDAIISNDGNTIYIKSGDHKKASLCMKNEEDGRIVKISNLDIDLEIGSRAYFMEDNQLVIFNPKFNYDEICIFPPNILDDLTYKSGYLSTNFNWLIKNESDNIFLYDVNEQSKHFFEGISNFDIIQSNENYALLSTSDLIDGEETATLHLLNIPKKTYTTLTHSSGFKNRSYETRKLFDLSNTGNSFIYSYCERGDYDGLYSLNYGNAESELEDSCKIPVPFYISFIANDKSVLILGYDDILIYDIENGKFKLKKKLRNSKKYQKAYSIGTRTDRMLMYSYNNGISIFNIEDGTDNVLIPNTSLKGQVSKIDVNTNGTKILICYYGDDYKDGSSGNVALQIYSIEGDKLLETSSDLGSYIFSNNDNYLIHNYWNGKELRSSHKLLKIPTFDEAITFLKSKYSFSDRN